MYSQNNIFARALRRFVHRKGAEQHFYHHDSSRDEGDSELGCASDRSPGRLEKLVQHKPKIHLTWKRTPGRPLNGKKQTALRHTIKVCTF